MEIPALILAFLIPVMIAGAIGGFLIGLGFSFVVGVGILPNLGIPPGLGDLELFKSALLIGAIGFGALVGCSTGAVFIQFWAHRQMRENARRRQS